jgi:hypothetical protein
VLLDEVILTPSQDPAQDHGNENRIVELSGHRHEVGDEVQRHGKVPGQQEHGHLPRERHSSIGKKPFEEDDAVGYEPTQCSGVLSSPKDQQHHNERDVDGQHHQHTEEPRFHRLTLATSRIELHPPSSEVLPGDPDILPARPGQEVGGTVR